MSPLVITILVLAAIMILSTIIALAADLGSGTQGFCTGIAIVCSFIVVFCTLISFLEPYTTEYTDLIPNTITKSTDGITMATHEGDVVVSDKAVIYLAPDTDIFVRVHGAKNHWGTKVTPKNKEIVVGE